MEAINRELAKEIFDVLNDAREELRLLRMKDTNVVYDPSLRARIAILIEKLDSKDK